MAIRKTKASHKLFAKMKKQQFFCMDLSYEGPAEVIKEGESRKGVLTMINEDKFRFVERNRPQVQYPQRCYKDLVGSLHGKISKNEHGVILHMYVRHEDYRNAHALADIFEREVEQMCDELCELTIDN